MTWTFNNSQNATTQATNTSATVTAPTGITTGDLLFMTLICVDGTGGTSDAGAPTLPSGWTTDFSTSFAGDFQGTSRITLAHKTATGSEPANYSVSWTNTARFDWYIVDITPPSGTIAADANGHTVTSGLTNMVAPSLTGLATSTDLLMLVFADCGGNSTYTGPAGVTQLFNINR
jgi:hypothetical protein